MLPTGAARTGAPSGGVAGELARTRCRRSLGGRRRHTPGDRRPDARFAVVGDTNGPSPADTQVRGRLPGGRYWDRTSDLLGVNEALYR
jgi:hypothetical protein